MNSYEVMKSYEVINSYGLVKTYDLIKNSDFVKAYKPKEKYKVLKSHEVRPACDSIRNQKVLTKECTRKTCIIEEKLQELFNLYLIYKGVRKRIGKKVRSKDIELIRIKTRIQILQVV